MLATDLNIFTAHMWVSYGLEVASSQPLLWGPVSCTVRAWLPWSHLV